MQHHTSRTSLQLPFHGLRTDLSNRTKLLSIIQL